jgi:hypothetical protein
MLMVYQAWAALVSGVGQGRYFNETDVYEGMAHRIARLVKAVMREDTNLEQIPCNYITYF